MHGKTVLTITKDSQWLTDLRPSLQAAGYDRLIVSETIQDACALLDVARPRMIVVQGEGEGCEADAISLLLWANSLSSRPAAVMVVADEYRVGEATVLFRLGVDEYVSAPEHGEGLSRVLATLSPSDAAQRVGRGGRRRSPRDESGTTVVESAAS